MIYRKTIETLPFTQQELSWFIQGLTLAKELYKDKETRDHITGLQARLINANPIPTQITTHRKRNGYGALGPRTAKKVAAS